MLKSIPQIVLNSISVQFSNRLLGISFIPLHFSIWDSIDTAFAKALLLMHIGLFLLWQPYLNHKTQIRTNPSIISLLAILGLIYLGGVWLQTIWVIFLIGILSSYRLSVLSDKLAFFIAIIYLLIELFGGLIPRSIITPEMVTLEASRIPYITSLLVVALLFIPFKAASIRNYSADLLYSLIAISLIILIAMTTAIWIAYGKFEYYTALIFACISLGGLFILFGLIFRPSSDVGILSQIKDRYLLNLGTPFETFLIETSTLNSQTQSPNEFLECAFERLTQLHWIDGFNWHINNQDHHVGHNQKHHYPFYFDQLRVILHSKQALGPSMLLHARLLIQIISIFHSLKARELELSNSAHMAAIHDTGARITHDIKNLLQSLSLVIETLKSEQTNNPDIIKNHIDVISQRLRVTLAKLQNPRHDTEQYIKLDDWWMQLQSKYAQAAITFKADHLPDSRVPQNTFDTASDNLIDNFEKKRQLEPNIQLCITVHSDNNQFNIEFMDDGAKVPDDMAAIILDNPVKSNSGFGIGLYQANKQLNLQSYQLSLTENKEGCVKFSLSQQTNS